MGLSSEEINIGSPYIVTNEEHRFLALEQLREIGIELGAAPMEPVARDTTPALTVAALAGADEGEDSLLMVNPADQTVADIAAFSRAMQGAIHDAARGSIVRLAVTSDRPGKGHGYIQAQVE
jgi:mannose-1-phosphate guanylyltransferase/mannose-6-phosphate isomerase